MPEDWSPHTQHFNSSYRLYFEYDVVGLAKGVLFKEWLVGANGKCWVSYTLLLGFCKSWWLCCTVGAYKEQSFVISEEWLLLLCGWLWVGLEWFLNFLKEWGSVFVSILWWAWWPLLWWWWWWEVRLRWLIEECIGNIFDEEEWVDDEIDAFGVIWSFFSWYNSFDETVWLDEDIDELNLLIRFSYVVAPLQLFNVLIEFIFAECFALEVELFESIK